MFNSKIYRQPGGSEMTFASGASLTFAAGANWKGTIGGTPTFPEFVTITQTVGSAVRSTATLTEFKAGACLAFNTPGPSQMALRFINGASTAGIITGQDATSGLWAFPGTLYIRVSGASLATLYVNTSQDATGGSTWNAFDKTSGLA
jgi:hypothetical protein